jgi:8-oxo-dGTP pyrophosphatase MutT (NUDIX family)
MAEIRATSTRVVYENPYLLLREDRVRRADGSEGVYSVVEKSDFALIVPVDADGRLWLVEQFRYPVGQRLWEFPQGGWPEHAGAGDPVELARRELREETGLRAGSLRRLGHLYEAYGYSDQGFDVFLATDLEEGEAEPEPGEVGMRSGRFEPAEIEEMIRGGTLKDAPTVAAYGLFRLGF